MTISNRRICGVGLLLLVVLLAGAGAARGVTITVGLDGTTSFSTVQAALDAATDGDEIVVRPGRYVENINFRGKNVVLRSTVPTDLSVVRATILDGNRSGSVVTFSGAEGTTCALSGFAITNGQRIVAGDGGGGIKGNGALATIEHNHIFDNTSTDGGGIRGCDGIIQRNTISYNSAETWGRAIGGGLAYCDGIIQNNIICFNSAVGAGPPLGNATGGGLGFCEGIIQNNTIYGNSCSGFLGGGGAGLWNLGGTIRNCIIWQNEPLMSQVSFVFGGPPEYSCIQNWSGAGAGNIASDPSFVDPGNGDFHLWQNSPCVDAGIYIPGLTEDYEGNRRISPYDIGAYEFSISTRARDWFLYY